VQALYDGNANNLKAWLLKCPRKQVTTLDTHDGIGIVDVADLMTEAEVTRTKGYLFKHGASVKERYNTSSYGALDTYQVRLSPLLTLSALFP
jgi:sucrose phosphorylase